MPTIETLPLDATIGSHLEKPHKFENLDALRGVAAILIVVYHTRPIFGSSRLFGRAYLAVDLFFMLSGFVLTFAYQQKLDNGLPTTTFLKLRLIRLYPLYLIGLFLGFIFTATQIHYQHSPPGLLGSFLLLIPALFFLPIPAPSSIASVAFPYDLPAWSLFSELTANLLHAVLLRNRSTRSLLIALLAFAALLSRAALHHGSLNHGGEGREILFGIERVLFSYLSGVLLYRLWLIRRHRYRFGFAIPCLLFCAILAMPSVNQYNAIFDLAAVFIAFPVIVFLTACSTPTRAFHWISSVLGIASYAIYVLHLPMEHYFDSLWKLLFKQWPQTSAPWTGLLFLPLPIIAALVLDAVYDVPMRRWLRNKFIA